MAKRILIVEDEQALSEAYQTILSQHGFIATIAANGEEALAAVATEMPDVILLDIMMPKMNGIEFLQELHKQYANEPAVIVFSNLDNQPEVDEAFRLGAKRYIVKSWASPQDLVRMVNEALKA